MNYAFFQICYHIFALAFTVQHKQHCLRLGPSGIIQFKRSAIGEKPIAHLEEIDARSRRIGGRFARKFFAVYRNVDPSIEQPLRSRAAALNIRVLTPQDLVQPASLAKT